uniref:Neuronal acetylcholine receptor subunit alpha-6 n=3 Tax=Magallana gigas TaxID=29159 RepID=A0A8W8KXI8_MAGGI|nr:neuronal acetylcholine receptor subunit alpha-3-like isoform X1 [Crassostrea gigas]
MKSIILMLALCLTIQDSMGEFSTTTATDIHTAIFNASYNKYVRPSNITYVGIEFHLLSINDMDFKRQIMSSSGWLTVTWEDPRLTWNASTKGDIEYIYTKQDKIWRPELIIDNSVEGMSPLGHDEIFFKVKHTGEVRWEPPGIYVTHCDFNVLYYPFDYQTCSVEVTSFAFTNKAVTFNSVSESTKNLKKNGEWVLHSLRGSKQNLTENGEEFSQVEFKVILKRLSRYYVNNVVYPVVVISLLTNVVFLVPAESGCKISYILTVLLTQAVLLTLIGNSMPTTSIQIPIIAMYISFVLLMAALATIITTLNVYLYLRTDQKAVPRWLKAFTFVVLLRINCRSAKVNEEDKGNVVSNEDTVNVEESNGKGKTMWNRLLAQTKDDAEFPFKCQEVSAFLDCFFFYLFNIVLIITTLVFLVVSAVSDVPPS